MRSLFVCFALFTAACFSGPDSIPDLAVTNSDGGADMTVLQGIGSQCGSATCTNSQVCARDLVDGGVDSPTCRELPPACLMDPTCQCIMAKDLVNRICPLTTTCYEDGNGVFLCAAL